MYKIRSQKQKQNCKDLFPRKNCLTKNKSGLMKSMPCWIWTKKKMIFSSSQKDQIIFLKVTKNVFPFQNMTKTVTFFQMPGSLHPVSHVRPTQINPDTPPYYPDFRKPKKKYPSTLPPFSLRHVQNRFYKQNWRQIWQNIIILRKRTQ